MSLFYKSVSAYPMEVTELEQLLVSSRDNNTRLGITGLLLYKDEQFLQALEGPEDAVRALYETIGADPRHHSVKRLSEFQVARPRFGEWSMGFRRVDEAEARAIPGYDNFLDAPPTIDRAMASREELLLEWFRTH